MVDKTLGIQSNRKIAGEVAAEADGTMQPNVSVKKVALKKVSSPKKKTLKITWKKVGDAAGFQIQLSTDKKFKKGGKKYYGAWSKVKKAKVK